MVWNGTLLDARSDGVRAGLGWAGYGMAWRYVARTFHSLLLLGWAGLDCHLRPIRFHTSMDIYFSHESTLFRCFQ